MKADILRDFADVVKRQDGRNRFRQLKECRFDVPLPNTYIEFIRRYNPVDIEIVFKDLNSCVLFPYEGLSTVQDEFKPPKNYFVFGAFNGADPFAFRNHKVYSAQHGQGEWNFSVRHASFELFLKNIMDDMK